MRLDRVIIVHKAESSSSKALAERCAQELEARGSRVLMGPSGFKDNPYPVFLASSQQPLDLAIVLGGDGAALAAARHLAPEGIPILAVNVGGHLGFLTESPEDFQDTPHVWERLESDLYAVQRRMMLQARLVEGSHTHPETASDPILCLNEMCVKPASLDRMPSSILEVEVDGDVVDRYHGDGLIVSTPTGSTCYNASAGGPILHAGMDAIAVTPICPLSLSIRSLILPPGATIEVCPLGDREVNTKLWTDGVLATTIWPGQRVNIRIADCQAKFIILREQNSFYQTLREKLQWAGTRVHSRNNGNGPA
ncbi:NAD(+) kinase [Oscillatoria sp. FACHB-1406]|uniref:NAD(+) kinase n=1 Tax=Oscillatoria sp. FACHB-1406 TaxID=2692846 RepID=UPI00168904B4|nr:NAD(+) kinase [Oscillatoria sp. FACHB-1406]